MKILHTADWHLGKRLERFDRSEEQRAILEEICEIADRENVDAVLIAGDLYDTYNPPIQATQTFYRHLKRLSKDGKRAVIAIAGNHDSPHRIEAPDPLARECGIIFTGYPDSQVPVFALDTGLAVTQSDKGFIELKLPGVDVPLRLLLTPYANPNRMRRSLDVDDPEAGMRDNLEEHWKLLQDKYCDDQGINILMAHLFMIKKGTPPPEEPEDEKPIHIGGASAVYTENVPGGIDYVALGHLHRHQNMAGGPCPCVYASSPLNYSFAEAGQDKYVVILEADPAAETRVNYRKVKLEKGRPLYREKFEDIDLAVEWLSAHQEGFVELIIVSDDYISAVNRKRLADAHPRIIGPIPEFKNPEALQAHLTKVADPSRSREALFGDYFRSEKGVEPGEDLMDLFREVIGKGGGK